MLLMVRLVWTTGVMCVVEQFCMAAAGDFVAMTWYLRLVFDILVATICSLRLAWSCEGSRYHLCLRFDCTTSRQHIPTNTTGPAYTLHPTGQSTWWCTTPLHQVPAPLEVTVHAGEVLYLPSLWFHGVKHGAACGACGAGDVVAVNYWFDMQYDARFCYHKAMERSIRGQRVPSYLGKCFP